MRAILFSKLLYIYAQCFNPRDMLFRRSCVFPDKDSISEKLTRRFFNNTLTFYLSQMPKYEKENGNFSSVTVQTVIQRIQT